MTRYSRDPILIPMKLDGKWAVGLLGGILGLFSMQLPWVVAGISISGGGSLSIGISAVTFLGFSSANIPGTDQAVDSSGAAPLAVMLIGMGLFAIACFLTMLNWRMSVLMFAGDILAWAGIGGLTGHASPISLGFGYGVAIGFLAAIFSLFGPAVVDYYSERWRFDSDVVERRRVTLDDVRWIRSRIRDMDDVEASAKKLKAAYEAGQISPWEYEQESEIIGETAPPDESGRI